MPSAIAIQDIWCTHACKTPIKAHTCEPNHPVHAPLTVACHLGSTSFSAQPTNPVTVWWPACLLLSVRSWCRIFHLWLQTSLKASLLSPPAKTITHFGDCRGCKPCFRTWNSILVCRRTHQRADQGKHRWQVSFVSDLDAGNDLRSNVMQPVTSLSQTVHLDLDAA